MRPFCNHGRSCVLLLFHVLLLQETIVSGCTARSSSSASAKKVNPRATATATEPGAEVIQCRDEDDRPVPWFIAYKLPRIRVAGAGPTFRQGTGYSYILPSSLKWTPSERPIGDQHSVVGETLKPFFQNLASKQESLLTIVYNDQPAFRDDFGYNGHAKGVIVAGQASGLWLIHSVPKFPAVPPAKLKLNNGAGGYYNFYPSTGLTNAQMFLCLSLNRAQIDEVASVFRLIRPHINNSTLPEDMKSVYPKLKEFLGTKRFSSRGPTQQVFPVATEDGLEFQLFAKSPRLDQEIYSEWLAPTLRSSLDVQSWLNGVNAFTSNCTDKFPVYNIKDKKVDGLDFSRNDHSKWAVGREKGEPWTCVSDLNRMEGQKSRGGSTVCLHNPKLWTAFNSAVIDLQPCPLNRG